MSTAGRHQSKEQHEAIHISMLDLLQYDPALAYHLLHNPLPLLDIFETAVQQLVAGYRQLPSVRQQRLQKQQQQRSMHALTSGGGGEEGGRFHVRLCKLPPTAEVTKATIGQLRVSADSQNLLQITGTVSKRQEKILTARGQG